MDPYAVAAEGVKAIIDAEFAPEQIVANHDKLHESLGLEGIEVGISPTDQIPMGGNALVLDTGIFVQFYGLWEKMVDPTQQVDPRLVTGWADRFRRAVEGTQANAAGSSEVWYYEVIRVEYPDDPTGNKSRFHAWVRARGDNTALLDRL
jgi:hypothetical protein